MNILSPSLLAADFGRLGEEIKAVTDAGVNYIHIDVMDGIFVPSISYGMPIIKSIRKLTNAVFDVHLIIAEPKRYIKEFVAAGADIITIHAEACKDVAETINMIKAANVKAGVAINPETPVERIIPYLESIDMALVMSVHPGFGGQKFIPAVLDKVKIIRHYCCENAIDIDIEMDGGIDLDNVTKVTQAGVNVVVAGTSIYRGDPYENTLKFLKLLQN